MACSFREQILIVSLTLGFALIVYVIAPGATNSSEPIPATKHISDDTAITQTSEVTVELKKEEGETAETLIDITTNVPETTIGLTGEALTTDNGYGDGDDEPQDFQTPSFVVQSCSPRSHIYLRFLHIPKSGGRSVVATFTPTFKKFKPITKASRTVLPLSVRTDQGHESYAAHQSHNVKAQECQRWITFFRHPVTRFISEFYTCFGRKTCHPYNGYLPVKKSIQYRQGRDINQFAAALEQHLTPKIQGKLNIYLNMLVPSKQSSFEQQLTMAKKRLHRMHFIGIQEHFDDSMALLSDTLNLTLVRYTPAFNFNPYDKSTITEKTKQILSSAMEWDIQLYNYALKLYQDRWESYRRWKHSKHCPLATFECDTQVSCWHRNDDAFKLFPPSQGKEQMKNPNDLLICASEQGCLRDEKGATCGLL
eukprot:m.122409 g.122409  ORF g.122409 m.122409 type:complete len:423 (+) comp23332_c0_seq1:24-1292(+)